MSENTHIPENWVLIKIQPKGEPVGFKVLGSWRGGYLYGDSWRINSGISSYESHKDYYIFHGYSGSKYKCFKTHERASGIMIPLLDELSKLGASLINVKEFKDEFINSNPTKK